MQTNGSWYRAGGLRTRRRYHDAREERSSEGGDVEIAAGRRSVNPCVRQDVFTSAGGFRARLHLWRKCGREVTSFPEGLCRAPEWPPDRTYTTQSGEGIVFRLSFTCTLNRFYMKDRPWPNTFNLREL